MNDKLMGQALIDAVVKHDIITVKQLIKQGVDVEYIDSQNMTAFIALLPTAITRYSHVTG
ncbi:hypothetical protein [Shewanella oncorhynchi]|uniref:hypothetical protein n=1 Tax=Shewanella oncorhynchi TaxID=2726434 RepID=UPI003D78F5BF